MLNCSKENRESTKIKIPKMRWDIHCQNLDIRPINKACTLLENRQERLYWNEGSSKVSVLVGKFSIMLQRIYTILKWENLSNFIWDFPTLYFTFKDWIFKILDFSNSTFL